MRLWKRLSQMWRQRKFEADLAEEIRIHREMSEQGFVEDGLAPEEARASSMRAFGSVAMTLEDSRAVWRWAWLDSLWQDIRYAIRGFGRSPGFALTVIGTIGIALGFNTMAFTIFNVYVLRTLAVLDPHTLYEAKWSGQTVHFSAGQYDDLRRQQKVFSDLLTYQTPVAVLDGRMALGERVSGNYFDLLGAGVIRGRPLLPTDSANSKTGGAAVLSHFAWQSLYGADPEIIGKKVYLSDQPHEVVGIMNPKFTGLAGAPVIFWAPLGESATVLEHGQEVGIHAVVRLRPGVSKETATAALLAWGRAVAPEAGEHQAQLNVTLESRATAVSLSPEMARRIAPVFVAFALVLLIACANVSNMMLARALARQHEIGIRISLGAARWRLIRQLLTESVLLGLPAALVGFAVSRATLNLGEWLLFETLPVAFAKMITIPDLSPDMRVFAFILSVSIAAALIFGLIPAIQTTRSRLVQASRTTTSDNRPSRLRSVLVVTQVAGCVLLLVCTGIILRTERRLVHSDLGLDPHNVLDLQAPEKYQIAAVEQLERDPAVEAVAAVWFAPLYGFSRRIAAIPSGSTEAVGASYNFVSPEYFSVMRLSLLRGRNFTPQEASVEAPVAIVSESTVRRFWPGSDGLGQRVTLRPGTQMDIRSSRLPGYPTVQVVGIVSDAVTGSIGGGTDKPAIYLPNDIRRAGNESLLIKINGPLTLGRRAVETILNNIEPNMGGQINPLEEVVAMMFYPLRVAFWVASLLGVLALVLATSGIFGVLSYLVSQRRKEIGIRIALGAKVIDIARMVLGQSMHLVMVGLVLGASLALGAAKLLASKLEHIDPYDLVTHASVAIVVVGAALAASYYPFRRAMRIDPVQTLRSE